ncbi:hypothetical protein O988_00657 [Pseudogymnoascus sp. VKM F-3808]|nr:hypothetical protein O988_00657 [Pseudogymnoascus sp. VKM F-3808]
MGLKTLPAKLAKRDTSLADAEARVKELEAELANLTRENQEANNSGIKSPVTTRRAGTHKALAGYGDTDQGGCGQSRQGRRYSTKAVPAPFCGRGTDKGATITGCKNADEAGKAAKEQAMEVTAQVTKSIQLFKEQFVNPLLQNATRHASTEREVYELGIGHVKLQSHITALQGQLAEMEGGQAKQPVKMPEQQPLGIEAEDRLLCPGAPKCLGGNQNSVLEFEKVADTKPRPGCVDVSEEVKWIEAEKKAKEQRRHDFAAAIQEEYDVVQVPQ